MPVWMLLLQGATPAADVPLRLDILDPSPATRCAAAQEQDDIVVCGQRDDGERYRIRSLPPPPDEQLALPRAATGLGGGVLSVEADQATMPTGELSKRAMFRFKLPF